MHDHQSDFFKPGISATGSINPFFNKGPMGFWRGSSYNPNRVKKEATAAMIFGRLVHNMVLTPELEAAEFAVAPVKKDYPGCLDTTDDLKGFLAQANLHDSNTGKPITYKSLAKPDLVKLVQMCNPRPQLWWEIEEQFQRTVGKRTIVTVEDMENARSMRDAMFANRAVKQLIGNGASEEPVVWQREPNGLLCKCKLDYNRSGLVIEYKTTNSTMEEDLKRTVSGFGYHRQMAWEVDAATVLSEERPRGALIIFQDSDLHDNIVIYPLSQRAMEIGNAENAYAYSEIKRRLELMQTGTPEKDAWRTHEEKIMEPLDLPAYYKNPIPA